MQTSTLVLQPFISPFAVLLVSLTLLPQIAPPHPPTVDTVQLLLSHRAISPNGVHPPASGTTPLHLAASLGRMDIVSLLLDQPGIDDTLRDANGKTSKDVAKGKEVIQILQGGYPFSLSSQTYSNLAPFLDSQSFLNASFRSLLRSYILSPMNASQNSGLVALLESPRARAVHLSYLEDASGTSLLHEAARRKDLRLIELAVRAGANVFVRDRRGKMAWEGTGKDDHVRVFLRQCTSSLHISLTHSLTCA
jgi:ankyrin repeat protein